MTRLIDADALKKAIDLPFLDEIKLGSIIDHAPTIEAEPVVHCKDCKHRNEKCGMGEHRWCETLNMSTVPNDFCSYGERREP